MAFEITKQELLRQANELLKKYNKSKDSDLKAQENRLRRIVSDLDSIGSLSSGVTSFNTRTGTVTLTSSDVITALGYTPSSGTPTLDQVTTAGNTTTNGISIGSLAVDTNLIYTDAVNNRVGIGTSGLVPGYIMTINGGVSISAGQSLNLDPVTNIYMVAASSQFRVYNNGAARLSISSTGNVLIGTTTDAGYKLDVNGTIRSTGAIWTDTLSPVGSTMYIYSAGLSGGGYNRLNIYYNSVNGFVMQSDGGGGGSRNMSIFGGGAGGVLNLGTNGTTRWTLLSSYDASGPGHLIPNGTNTYDIGNSSNTIRNLYSNRAIFSGSVTASAALANSVSIANTLVASANNDVLVGLDINPTFTNGAFTGVSNYALRTTNSTVALFDSVFYSQTGPSSSNTFFSITGTQDSHYTISSHRNFVLNTSQSMYFNTDTDGGSAAEQNWYFGGGRSGTTGGRTRASITTDSSGFSRLIVYNDDNGAKIKLDSNAASHFNGGNVLIGTTTDAGYKLDVNGTARVGSLGLYGYNGANTAPLIKFNGSNQVNVDPQGYGTVTGHFLSTGNYIFSSGGGIRSNDRFAAKSGTSVVSTPFMSYGISRPDADVNMGLLAGIGGVHDGASWAQGLGLVFYTSNGPDISGGGYLTEKMRITSAGNVGIGTTAPEGPLHVKYSSATVPGITIENDGVGYNAGSMTLRSGTSGGVNMSVTSGGGLYWYNLNTFSNSLSLPSTGNLIVGGAVDAGYRLDVKGGNARFEQNVDAASYSVAGNAGYSGIINFPGNPPGSQNLEFLQGILINVF